MSEKQPAKAPEKQVVFIVGNHRGLRDGDRREVSPERAAQLVRDGLARYPLSKR